MQNVIDFSARQLHGIEIEEVRLPKLDLPQDLGKIFPLTG